MSNSDNKLISNENTLTFDDVLLVPALSEVLPTETTLETTLAKNLTLNIPILSAAMDQVTESAMAIQMAKIGGLGVIHKNMSIEDQSLEVSKVKALNLKCAAAIGTGDKEKDRAKALVLAKVDALVVDTAHGHSKNVRNMVEFIKKNYPETIVIAGNIATYDAAKYLIEAGVDCLKVGMGAGSICTTRIISGVGVPQLSALLEVQRACAGTNVSFIADGGLKTSGDLAKALATGACCVMVGSLISGTDATPGEIINIDGKAYKNYRGMGSLSAMERGSADRYKQENVGNKEKLVPEGVEAKVLYKGSLETVVHQLTGGIRAAMGYTGCINIEEFHRKTKFCKITNSSLAESHVHGVNILQDSPNYKR